MIHKWELILNEFFWPMFGFYIGNKIHRYIALPLALAGFVFAEYLIVTALINGWVLP